MTRMQLERRKKGWSQQVLGYHSRIQAPELSKIERLILRPYPSQVARLAAALGLQPDELLEEVEESAQAVLTV